MPSREALHSHLNLKVGGFETQAEFCFDYIRMTDTGCPAFRCCNYLPNTLNLTVFIK